MSTTGIGVTREMQAESINRFHFCGLCGQSIKLSLFGVVDKVICTYRVTSGLDSSEKIVVTKAVVLDEGKQR